MITAKLENIMAKVLDALVKSEGHGKLEDLSKEAQQRALDSLKECFPSPEHVDILSGMWASVKRKLLEAESRRSKNSRRPE